VLLAPKGLHVIETNAGSCTLRWTVPHRQTHKSMTTAEYHASVTGYQILHNGTCSLPMRLTRDRLGNVKWEAQVRHVGFRCNSGCNSGFQLYKYRIA
jgi:hypothetical protein